MRHVGNRTAEAERAAVDPPASLSRFCLTQILPLAGPESLLGAYFDVCCKACAGDVFQVGWFPLIAPDPSPYYAIAPGEVVKRPPHRMKCTACGAVETIFDARTDGYDGLLNGGCSYESGETGEVFTGVAYRIVVSPIYNIEISELEELASEAGAIKATDLFDGLTIIAEPTGGGPLIELIYECA